MVDARTGERVRGAAVMVYRAPNLGEYSLARGHDGLATVRFKELETLTFGVDAPGYRRRHVARAELLPGDAGAEARVELERGFERIFRLHGPGGAPIRGAELRAGGELVATADVEGLACTSRCGLGAGEGRDGSTARISSLAVEHRPPSRPRRGWEASMQTPDLAQALVRRAILAPSSHNTQPWLFRIAGEVVELLADRKRALPVNDPEDRELTLSCGCSLMILRIAAADAGLSAKVELLPDSADPDLLARVTLHPDSAASLPGAELLEFVERRRTYRRAFLPRPVEAVTVGRLIDAADLEGAWLRPITDPEARLEAARLVSEGDARQWADPRWRRELAAWMHPRRRGDGLTIPALAAPLAQVVVRTFDLGGGVGAKDRQLAQASPLLAVLGTDSDDPLELLRAGQALQRVLLVACQDGLQASYLNQPIQVAALRPELGKLVEGDFPQILMRLGYPSDELPPSPRRALEDVLVRDGRP